MEGAPSTIEKILLQMNTAAQFTDTFVCFSYLSLDPFVQSIALFDNDYPIIARTKLYNDYKAYYESVKE